MITRRILAALLLLLMLPCISLAESCIVNLIENPQATYSFAEGAPILEIVFPRVHSSDCAVLRMGDEVLMLDASIPGADMQARIQSALEAMGVTHIDVAFNSHPHNDHIGGFAEVYKVAPFDKLIITYPEDFNKFMVSALGFMADHSIPVEHAADGDLLSMGPSGEVSLHVIQRNGERWTENDQSAMLMVKYGERSILFSADVENRAQADYAANPPAIGIDADILKYPHHGLVRMNSDFLSAVSPEITLINGGLDTGREGREYMKRKKLPFLVGYKGLTRMRTDGQIWVIDYLDEVVTNK